AFDAHLGPTHSRTLRVLLDLAEVTRRAGDLDAAESRLRLAGALIRRSRTDWHPLFAEYLGWHASLLHSRGRDDLAAEKARLQVTRLAATTGERTYTYAVAMGNLGVYLSAIEGGEREAEASILAARRVLRDVAPEKEDDDSYLNTFNVLGL